MSAVHTDAHKHNMSALVIGALGVVFGDIGTSPLYAVKESLAAISGHGGLPSAGDVFGIISMILWSLLIVITIKYVLFIMRADNKGEGGIMALTALALRSPFATPLWRILINFLGICGLALFFGDGVITPAISVLSAVEGLELATPVLQPVVVPVTVIILLILFLVQRRGTAGVGAMFGPIMLLWFSALALLGIYGILKHPQILGAIDPRHALDFFLEHRGQAFLVLGAVFLSVTGAEALYADMGHFGCRPIQLAWLFLVFPALVLNYFGQGGLILDDPQMAKNPFYLLAPSWGLYPLVGMATAATVIASQAVISGAFSAARQAMQLGFLPRMEVIHTSSEEEGQIYVPTINWILLVAVLILVFGFRSSSNLASAYGIAVTGAMVIDTTIAFGVVLRTMFGWSLALTIASTLFFLLFDVLFFAANALKIPDGGWFPLLLGSFIFLLMSTWKRGTELCRHAIKKVEIPLEPFLRQVANDPVPRSPGVGIYLSTNGTMAPQPLVQNLQHHWVIHETVAILTIRFLDTPHLGQEQRVLEKDLGNGFHHLTVRFGFTETPDIPRALQHSRLFQDWSNPDETSFFLGRTAFFAEQSRNGLPLWRIHMFLWMQRNASNAASWFRLPAHRVVEMGARVIL
ncbi:potassium transporter Kup [Candidatus Magnetaquicoccus inordinatus]|uniref:potassium transporter Kup n=1 Tax=Candidatus Magnetaquicoccus inordinatus TaxID=2496818 RepID=UPI00102D275E|nr:potassium transporter Kup [Candidatus Magnetaquicoccus inordinatus]